MPGISCFKDFLSNHLTYVFPTLLTWLNGCRWEDMQCYTDTSEHLQLWVPSQNSQSIFKHLRMCSPINVFWSVFKIKKQTGTPMILHVDIKIRSRSGVQRSDNDIISYFFLGVRKKKITWGKVLRSASDFPNRLKILHHFCQLGCICNQKTQPTACLEGKWYMRPNCGLNAA